MISRLVELTRSKTVTKGEHDASVSSELVSGGPLRLAKTDLSVGDSVRFITRGRLEPGFWTVYGLTNTRVLCEKGHKKSFRAYKNVRKAV